MIPRSKKILIGTVKRNPDGFGFLIPEKVDHPDVYLPRNTMEGIMTSDKVMVQVEPERGGDRFRGEVLKIVERGFKRVVGAWQKTNENYGTIKDEGKGWGEDLKVKTEDSLGAKPGQLVAVEVLTYPDDKRGFTGRVSEVLGSSADPMNDIRRVLLVNNIPQQFSQACLQEAKKFSEHVEEKDMAGRKDIRHLKFVTIDGATAKDFDDAVYCETSANGFLLYVAIADVSHYVQVGSAIDKDAYERGTSVYYPNFVVPMLPEVLSNGLCSLNPHLPRLALVAEMQIDFNGELKKSVFYEAVIESKARVTYGEAQELIEGNPIEKLRHVTEEIKRCSDLAKILMARRFREGSLDLEIPETQLLIDAQGVPIDVIRSERLFAHRVIEEMMLIANVAVAQLFTEKEIPAIYRVHDAPNAEALQVLEKYLQTFGGNIQLSSGKLQKRLTKALEEFQGKPQANILNILTLRSMAQAKYSNNNVGHFGLGFENYTHFTSPIRRYPDLIVHRLIKSLIMPGSKYRIMSEDDLATAAVMLSACEQRAVKSERQLMGIKKARFMEKHLGQEFDGIISSVVKFGIFVLLRGVEVDGLVRIEDLGAERYEFDEDNLRLVAKRSGHSYAIGDMVRVRVDSVDIENGQINFAIAGIARKEQGARAEKGPSLREVFKRKTNDRNENRSEERPAHRSEQKSGHRSNHLSDKSDRSHNNRQEAKGERRHDKFKKSERPSREDSRDADSRGPRGIKSNSRSNKPGVRIEKQQERSTSERNMGRVIAKAPARGMARLQERANENAGASEQPSSKGKSLLSFLRDRTAANKAERESARGKKGEKEPEKKQTVGFKSRGQKKKPRR